MNIAKEKKLREYIYESGGLVTTRGVEEQDIHREYLSEMVREGVLDRVGHGIYLARDAWSDELYIKQINRKNMVYSHSTALYLHDLIDRDPLRYEVTVPRGYNASRLRKDGLRVHTINKDWFELGIMSIETVFGNDVRTYDMERTICDILRDRNNQDTALLNDALRRYFASKDKDLNVLASYARTLKIDKVLRLYWEVLL